MVEEDNNKNLGSGENTGKETESDKEGGHDSEDEQDENNSKKNQLNNSSHDDGGDGSSESDEDQEQESSKEEHRGHDSDDSGSQGAPAVVSRKRTRSENSHEDQSLLTPIRRSRRGKNQGSENE